MKDERIKLLNVTAPWKRWGRKYVNLSFGMIRAEVMKWSEKCFLTRIVW